MRQYVGRLLAEHYDVETVPDGKAALDAVRERPPNLILSDVMMPVLDGFELLKAIRASEHGTDERDCDAANHVTPLREM